MIGAARLNVSIYEDVEGDTSATGQALVVVIVSSVAAGVGFVARGNLSTLIIHSIAALLTWFTWSLLTYFIGTKLLPEAQTRSNVGELLRTTGFSSSPGVLHILGVVPVLGRFVWPVVSIWMLVTMVIAVRQALDYKSTGRALGVCFIGWIIYFGGSFLAMPVR
jgi:hypothetical protein